MSDTVPDRQIQKIRTYASDFARAQKQSDEPETPTPPATAAPAPVTPTATPVVPHIPPAPTASPALSSTKPPKLQVTPTIPPPPERQQPASAKLPPPPLRPPVATKPPTPKQPPAPVAAPAGLTGNPPFHFIRESSTEDTTMRPGQKVANTFTSQPVKQRPRVTPPAPPQKDEEEDTIIPSSTGYHARESLLSSEDDIFNIPAEHEGVGDGSIVTDKKRHRQHLFKAIYHSVKKWFGKKKETLLTPSQPPKTITRSDTRAEQIKQAATASAIAPKDDYQVVTKTLKQVERTPAPTLFNLKEAKPKTTKPTWTHLIEEEEKPKPVESAATPVKTTPPAAEFTPVSERTSAPSATSTPTEMRPQTPPTRSTIRPASVVVRSRPTPTPFVPEPAAQPARPTTPVKAPVTPSIPPAPTAPAPAPARPAPPPVPPAPTPAEKPTIPPAPPTESTPQPAPSPAQPSQRPMPVAPSFTKDTTARTNATPRNFPIATTAPRRSPVLIVLVSLVAIGLGSATAWYFFGDIKSSEPITLVAIPADVNADRQIAVATPVSSAELLDGLTKAMKAAPAGITQLYPTTVGNEGLVRPATSAEIFSVLDTTTAPGGFIRTINRASFGAVDGEVPFIILKVQSFDAALSGMIAWEQSMSDDLWPFFGPVVTNSFDPNARTTNQIRPAFFTDTLINNRDVRLLRNELREERILYSFLDRNTILITTTRDAFVKLLPLVK